ncbi:MAG: energy transducer TonB [Pseudomonadota bacterium]
MATPASSDDSEVLALPLEAAQEYWRINEIQMPEELIEAEAEEDGGCVVIGFIIEADGSTSSHQPVFAWPNDRLVDDAVRAVAQATFKPTRQNKERLPVYTTHTLMTTEQLAGRPDLTTLNMLVVDHCNKRTRQHWEELQGNSESR